MTRPWFSDRPVLPPVVLAIGDLDRTEFSEAAASLARGVQLVRATGIQQAIESFSLEDVHPDVIVLAQAWPGQFSLADVDRLRQAAPLTRIIGLLGSWCEGEARSGAPWPGVPRIYWHQWPVRWRTELARHATGVCPAWGQPVTFTEEERLLLPVNEMDSRQGTVALSCHDPAVEAWLSAALGAQDYSCVAITGSLSTRIRGVDAALWEEHACDAAEVEDLKRLVAALAPAPVLALLSFPRAEDCERTLSGGAVAILSKPLLLGDLFAELERVLPGRRSSYFDSSPVLEEARPAIQS